MIHVIPFTPNEDVQRTENGTRLLEGKRLYDSWYTDINRQSTGFLKEKFVRDNMRLFQSYIWFKKEYVAGETADDKTATIADLFEIHFVMMLVTLDILKERGVTTGFELAKEILPLFAEVDWLLSCMTDIIKQYNIKWITIDGQSIQVHP